MKAPLLLQFLLPQSLAAFGSPAFEETLKSELLNLPRNGLPLDDVATPGAWVDLNSVGIRVLGFTSNGPEGTASPEAALTPLNIAVRIGVFFTETIGNCGCGDDPYDQNGYAEMALSIDGKTGQGTLKVL